MDPIPLVRKFAPILFFHPDEKYFSTSVDEFLQKAELRLLNRELKSKGPKLKHDVAVPAGEASAEKIVDLNGKHPTRRLQLHIDGVDRYGAAPDRLDGVPIYAVVKEIASAEEGKREAIEINYIFFFAFNGPYNVLGVEVGAHVADWEHLTVRLFPDGKMQGVYYNSHRNIDGDWLPAKEVPMKDGRPMVFLAKHGHGCYPRPGKQLRLFGFANDVCSGDGPVWRPKKIILLKTEKTEPHASRGCCLPCSETGVQGITTRGIDPCLDIDNEIEVHENSEDWDKFQGYWGTVVNPTQQGWFNRAENPTSRGWVKRLFLPMLAC
ncbi:hypothetical protein BSKO_08165 [Bryopsis sp. KO-2023]|nr:hypothetical protein BSKO_08165 [Bryopsis sp. KO-2023]